MKILTTLMLCLALGACATWNTETKVEETTFLTLHAVDGLQTANIARTRGCFEAESGWAIGREPSSSSTAAYFAAIAVAHFAVTDLLVKYHANPWIIRSWELVGIALGAQNVVHNASIGIKLQR